MNRHRWPALFIVAALAADCLGCSTAFYGSAPMGGNRELIVGSREGRPAAWICPTVDRPTECRRIEVSE